MHCKSSREYSMSGPTPLISITLLSLRKPLRRWMKSRILSKLICWATLETPLQLITFLQLETLLRTLPLGDTLLKRGYLRKISTHMEQGEGMMKSWQEALSLMWGLLTNLMMGKWVLKRCTFRLQKLWIFSTLLKCIRRITTNWALLEGKSMVLVVREIGQQKDHSCRELTLLSRNLMRGSIGRTWLEWGFCLWSSRREKAQILINWRELRGFPSIWMGETWKSTKMWELRLMIRSLWWNADLTLMWKWTISNKEAFYYMCWGNWALRTRLLMPTSDW